ncbi:MAG: putative Histidine kinase [Fibrobacteres bacterium]|nr:putative Histidine kinase [Fibrobacterota bacterium]
MAGIVENLTPESDKALALALTRAAEDDSIPSAIVHHNADAQAASGLHGEDLRNIMKPGSIADSLFNLVDNPTFIVDSANRILQVNDSGKRLFGHLPENAPFHSEVFLRPIGVRSGSSREFPADWLAGGVPMTGIDMSHQRQDGEIRYFQIDAKPILDAKMACTGGLISLTDITDRKRAEIQSTVRNGQLHYQLQLTKSITDNVSEGLILMDQQDRVILQNRASARLFGLPEGALIGKLFFDRIQFEPDPDVALPIPDFTVGRPLVSGKQSFRALLVQADGTRIPTHCFHSILATGDGSLLVISDIRVQIQAEKALVQSVQKQRQSQKMEAIGRLAGGIAHDFNNLLHAILGFTDLTLAMTQEPVILSNLTEVKKAGDRAVVLTSQLLAYSRKQVIALKTRPINDVVEECRKLLDRLIGENIRIEIDLSEKALKADMDEAKIQQVLINIALNARDSMQEGGTLGIRTLEVDLAKQDASGTVGELLKEGGEGPPPGRYAVIEVTDTGHGMSAETLDRLFEPFFTTKDFGKGSGLGLSTAFGIVRQMNGYIQVFSKVDKGSMFKILLPMAEGAVHEHKPIQKSAPNLGSGETILVVEDETVVRKLIVQILTQTGYRVIEACNGVDALEKVASYPPHLDLIVTDVLMDKMGGIELAVNLKKQYPDVNILFISGYAAETYEFPVSDFGESFFLAKPFYPGAFLKKIQSLLKMKRALSGSTPT